jgi:hypothetical protein
MTRQSGRPDESVKKSPKMYPGSFFDQIDTEIVQCKKKNKHLVCFCGFLKTAQSKQSPNERKFAQSGYLVFDVMTLLT